MGAYKFSFPCFNAPSYKFFNESLENSISSFKKNKKSPFAAFAPKFKACEYPLKLSLKIILILFKLMLLLLDTTIIS